MHDTRDHAPVSLTTVGIRSINLAGTPVDGVTEFGEVAIANTGSFTLTNSTTRTPQMIEASPLPPRVFDPSSFYFSMYDWMRQSTWRGGIDELVDLGALAVPSSDVGRIADIRQHEEYTSAEPFVPDVAENVDPITPDTSTDEVPAVPTEPRRLLDRSGYELWGGPEWIGSLPAPEMPSEATPTFVAAMPVASSNLPDAQNELMPAEPAPTAVIDPHETLADAEVAIAPLIAGQEDRPRLDPAQHELWGGPLYVSFIPPSDDVENADPTVAAPISEAPHGSVDAEIARKLAMIRQDLSTFGATGVGEIERLRQLPAQAMDIFALRWACEWIVCTA